MLAGCATVPPAGPPMAARDICGTYGYVDVNSDGQITGTEWNTYRTGAYAGWDINADGRVDRSEFESCWRGGGFYQANYYNPEHWTYYWSAFDTNNDGWLSGDEYWSASAWARIDANANGRIDASEWTWWPM
jgi:hypothetical protein